MNCMLSAALRLYSLAWKGAVPLLRRHRRLRAGFSHRLVPPAWPAPECVAPATMDVPRVIWLQAASGGEAWLAHSLIRALGALLADTPPPTPLTIVCTTCTEQGLAVLQKIRPEDTGPHLHAVTQYFPLDDPALMRKAVRQSRAALLVLLETELWPGLLCACREQDVPVLVLNGRMTEKSRRGYAWIASFWQQAGPERVLAISPHDAANFAFLLGKERVDTMANMKFDLVQADAASPQSDTPPTPVPPVPAVPCIALASVREEEEPQIMELVRTLRRERIHGTAARLVIAPRHMHRVAAWQRLLESSGIAYTLRDQQQKSPEGEMPSVLLWNTFGEMQALYAMADAVFVGGSLAPLGGQNFLEPLQAGCIVHIGPHWRNFHWAGTGLMENGLVRVATDAADLEQALVHSLLRLFGPDPAMWEYDRQRHRNAVRNAFSRWLAPHTGGSRQAAQAILEMLPG